MLFAAEAGISGVVMGALIINGAHAGGFSPISVAGVLVREISEKNHFAITPIPLFLSSYAINLIVSIITVVVMGMMGRLHTRHPDEPASTHMGRVGPINRIQAVTLGLIGLILIAALVFKLPIGFVGLTAGLILAFFSLDQHKNFVSGISWSTVLLVAGMITYVSILQDAGVIDGLADHAVKIGVPLVVALVLCYVIGVSSAFASSTALLTAFIPLAAPLLAQSSLSAAGVVAALAISATIVDVSPFSTDGALVVANAQGRDKDRIYTQLLIYAGFIVALAPALTWALLVPTGII
jgi:di/tricarboxylate transporter